jgi:hypothetical protein
MLKKVLMTFDLKDANPDDYPAVYEALVKFGLSRFSRDEKLRLPASTVFGTLNTEDGADELKNKLTKVIESAGNIEVSRIMVAIVTDWSVSGYADFDAWLEEILVRAKEMTKRLRG